LSGRGLCDELITRPEESYRLWCVVVCDLETSRIGAPYIYDITSLRVNDLMYFREILAVYRDNYNEQAGNNAGSINIEVNGIHSNHCEQLRQPKTALHLSWV